MDVNTREEARKETMEETRKNYWKRDRRLCLYKKSRGQKLAPLVQERPAQKREARIREI
jgi:5-methylcytosine-specific restriction endonuclease McrA